VQCSYQTTKPLLVFQCRQVVVHRKETSSLSLEHSVQHQTLALIPQITLHMLSKIWHVNSQAVQSILTSLHFNASITTLCLKKSPLACYKFDILFDIYVIQTVSNQTVIYFPMSPNQCLCATWQNMGTRKLQLLTQMYCCFAEVQLVAALFLQYSWLATHTQCCCMSV